MGFPVTELDLAAMLYEDGPLPREEIINRRDSLPSTGVCLHDDPYQGLAERVLALEESDAYQDDKEDRRHEIGYLQRGLEPVTGGDHRWRYFKQTHVFGEEDTYELFVEQAPSSNSIVNGQFSRYYVEDVLEVGEASREPPFYREERPVTVRAKPFGVKRKNEELFISYADVTEEHPCFDVDYRFNWDQRRGTLLVGNESHFKWRRRSGGFDFDEPRFWHHMYEADRTVFNYTHLIFTAELQQRDRLDEVQAPHSPRVKSSMKDILREEPAVHKAWERAQRVQEQYLYGLEKGLGMRDILRNVARCKTDTTTPPNQLIDVPKAYEAERQQRREDDVPFPRLVDEDEDKLQS